MSKPFVEALVASRRSPSIADADDLFGFLLGSWDLNAVLYDASGHATSSRGELHVAWVLEGRAIQDLFIFPRRADRVSGVPAHGDRYATTLRTLDREQQAWRVAFINPADPETSAQLLARRRGHDIVMEGQLANGTAIRWRYQAITSISFHYSAENLSEGAWHLYLELFGKRAAA